MIEPTETEPLEEMDRLIDVFEKIAAAASQSPESFENLPANAPVGKVDEVWAARNLILTWEMQDSVTSDK
jgi:glycine dehydrogenase subunit 2